MKCPDKPFKAAEPNAKSWLRNKGIIDEYLNILNQKEFEKANRQFSEHALKEYGIAAQFMYNNDVHGFSDKVVINKEAFEAIDFINNVKYNSKTIDVANNQYIQQLNLQKEIKDELGQIEYNDAVNRLQDMTANGIDQFGDSHVLYDPTFNIFYESNSNPIPRGGLANLVNLKQESLKIANNKLSKAFAHLKEVKDDATETNKTLAQIRTLQDYINGNEDKKIVGLKTEIENISKVDSRDPILIAPYVEKELERLKALVQSDDPTDNNEAKEIIDFIEKMGNFSKPSSIAIQTHPIYDYDELFDKDGELMLSDEVLAPFKAWREEAELRLAELDGKMMKISMDNLNGLPQVKKLYNNKQFTFKELSEQGLQDASWIDQMVMSIDGGILSHNGLIPQAIKAIATGKFNEQQAWSKHVEESINKLLPEVEKKLAELGFGFGVSGLRSVKYSLFQRQYKNGNKIGELVYKYSPEYQDAKNKIIEDFNNRITYGQSIKGPRGIQIINSAYQKRNNWILNNNLFINPSLLNELKNNPEFDNIKHLFSNDDNAINEHTNNIKELVGDIHYKAIIEAQTQLLKEYIAQKENKRIDLLLAENKADDEELSEAGKSKLNIWDANYSPFEAAEYMKRGTPTQIGSGEFHSKDLRFNSYVPYKIKDGKETDYYDDKYDQIEKEPILKEFYDVISEALSGIMDRLDNEDKRNINERTIPLQQKKFLEYFFGEDVTVLQRLGTPIVDFFDSIKNIFGVKKQQNITSKDMKFDRSMDVKINNQLVHENSGKINQLFQIRSSKVLNDYNTGRKKSTLESSLADRRNSRLLKLEKDTKVVLTSSNRNDLLRILRPYLTQEDTQSLLLGQDGDEIQIGKIVYDACQSEVVHEHSFDLPRIIKAYSSTIAQYAARREMLPLIQMMKDLYKKIPKVATTNSGLTRYNIDKDKTYLEGTRDRANAQMEDWFHRVILGNYGLRNQYGISDTKVYNRAERKLKEELDLAIDNEKDEIKKNELITQRESLGKNVAISGFFDALMSLARFGGLAWNIGSGLNNLLEGQVDNSMAAYTGNYFSNPNLINKVSPEKLIRGNLTRRTIGQKSEEENYTKAKFLMEHYDFLKDRTNELQKAISTGAFSHLQKLNPYNLQKEGEFLNQTPLCMAVLSDTPIKDKNGNESNVFDAFTRKWNEQYKKWDVVLKDEFRTEHNIKNWEHTNGEDYNAAKQKVDDSIRDIHGDYDPNSGMMAKSYQIGQAALMFKGWLPRQYYIRFGVQQDRIDIGVKSWEGRYHAHTALSGLYQGALLTAFTVSPWLMPVGAVAGYFLGNRTGKDSALSTLQELYHINRLLARKMLGFPINIISRIASGKNLISEDWEKLFKKMESKDFTRQDFNNYRANIQQMALTCTYIALLLLTKGLLFKDPDKNESEEDKKKRYWHNIFANRFMNLAGQLTTYDNIMETYRTVSNMAILRTFSNLVKTGEDFDKFIKGQDTILSGKNAGESALGNQLKKTFLPGIIADPFGLGFSKQGQQQFQQSPYDSYFHGEEYKAQHQLKQLKAEEKAELEDEDLTDKEIKKKLNHDFPKRKKNQKYYQILKKYEEAHKDD